MLYLITGKPGSGKTLHMISMLMHKKDLQGRLNPFNINNPHSAR